MQEEGLTMEQALEAMRSVAVRLPSGLVDAQALVKLVRENVELLERIARPMKGQTIYDLVSEAVDVFYYALKAHHNRLLDAYDTMSVMLAAANVVHLNLNQLLLAFQAKYESRIRLGKHEEAELAAIRRDLPGLDAVITTTEGTGAGQ